MGVVIDYEHQLVRIATPNGGELVVQGESDQCGLILYSAGRASRYLQQGCSGYVIYVMDTQEKGHVTMDDVSFFWEYPDVFPKEFARVAPESHVEFRIDLCWVA